MNWWILFGALLLGLLLAVGSVGVSIKLANRYDILDYPDSERKVQQRPIPKLGGLAVAVAFTVVASLALAIADYPNELPLALGAVLPALLAGLVGYLDDRRHLNPYLRLALQALTGLLVWYLGSRVEVFAAEWLNALAVMGFVVILINGLNLLDNSDGLAASTVTLSGLGAAIIAVIFGQELVSILGFALVGVSLGFLWHNWFPARVYMGDSGAYFLATLLAVLIIRLRPDTVEPSAGLLIALLLIALPLVDTTYVVTKRLSAGIHPFTAGRDHLSHVLQNRGQSVPGSVVLLQVLGLIGPITAVVVAVAAG